MDRKFSYGFPESCFSLIYLSFTYNSSTFVEVSQVKFLKHELFLSFNFSGRLISIKRFVSIKVFVFFLCMSSISGTDRCLSEIKFRCERMTRSVNRFTGICFNSSIFRLTLFNMITFPLLTSGLLLRYQREIRDDYQLDSSSFLL